jgi:hypothetical protein
MPITEVEMDDLSSVGSVTDEPPYQLKPEAWSLTNNVRDIANGIERLKGWTSTFGTPPDSPMHLLYVASAAQPWWLWASGTKIYVWDGSIHTDITRTVGGNYAGPDPKLWNSCILGGIPVLNNGVDPPQYWASYSTGTKMQPVTAWPASTTCKVIRSFLNYLIALNVTVSGINSPHRVRWSTEAQPGSLPPTWDVTDTTQEAGQFDLPDVDSGQILDGLSLRGQFYVYKEMSVWRLQFIGGVFIFDDKSFIDTAGILSTRCVAATADGLKHVFATQDDLMWHDGQQAESLLDRRMRRYLFNQIDPTHYDESFVFSNPLYNEMWFCYPSNGSAVCNRALVWNFKSNSLWEADIGFQGAMSGTLNQGAGTTWTAATGPWSSDLNPWLLSFRRKTVIYQPTANKFYMLDNGSTRDGAAFTGTIQRTGLSIIGKKRTGEWIEDPEHGKLVSKVWPKASGGPLNVRVGYQEVGQGPVSWTNPQSFDPSVARFVDGVLGSGKLVAIEFSAAADFRIDGYKLDMSVTGKF